MDTDSGTLTRTEVVQATIKRESAEQTAEAKLYSETKSAEGLLYKQRQDAEANCVQTSALKITSCGG